MKMTTGMLCEDCKFECGYWECSSDWEEYYLWDCKKGLSPCDDTETCESYEKEVKIIVDNVDVSGCPSLKCCNNTEENMMCMEYIDGSCEGHNCQYKQLQRLKDKNKELKKYIKGFVSNCKYCDEWYADKCAYTKKQDKYRQVLEEIREIASSHCSQCREIIDKINEVLK